MRIKEVLVYNLVVDSRINQYLARSGCLVMAGAAIFLSGLRAGNGWYAWLYMSLLGLGLLMTLRGLHTVSRYRIPVTCLYLIAGALPHLLYPEIG